MKLYTEEQVKEAIDLARVILNNGSPYPKYIILSEIKGIELPSNDEIDNYADFAFPNAEKIGKENYSAYKGMKIGAKWVIEQIKQQADGN